MKRKILRLISSALACTVIAGSSIACPLTVQAEESYVTRYDYVTGLFSYDVCSNQFICDSYNIYYPLFKLYVKKGTGDTEVIDIDPRTKEIYINPDSCHISEFVRDFNPNRVIVDYDVLTEELVEQLGVNMYGRDVEEILEKVNKGFFYAANFKMTETSIEFRRDGQRPRGSFSDVELGSEEFSFFDENGEHIKDNTVGSATSFLFADYTGVICGYPDGSFKPKAYITNEDAAVMVYEMLKNPYFTTKNSDDLDYVKKAYVLPEPNRELLKGYADGESVSEYARDAVSVLIQLNLITPEGNCLNPKAFAATSYVNKIYANVNSFFKTYGIDNCYQGDPHS